MRDKLFNKILFIIPIMIMILIFLISSTLFNTNRIQTYERVKSLKESEVQVLVTQIDEVIEYSKSPLNDNQRYMLKTAINKINSEKGVYCYLLNKNFEMESDFSKSQKRKFGELIIDELHNHVWEFNKNKNCGYIRETIKHENHRDNIDLYWQEVPTGDSEYYIVLAVNLEEIQVNEAIDSCKIMIGLLNIILTFSLYANILNCKDKDKDKK